jgi:hypothetical protein
VLLLLLSHSRERQISAPVLALIVEYLKLYLEGDPVKATAFQATSVLPPRADSSCFAWTP